MTQILDGESGRLISILANDAFTLQSKANLILKGATSVTLAAGSVVTFRKDGASLCREVSRNS